MKLPTEGARWFVHLRWVACVLVFVSVWLAWTLENVANPLPLYLVGAGMVLCNALFWFYQRSHVVKSGRIDRHITLQIVCDIVALTLLLYFSDLTRNPFLFYFVLPMIIAGMYLRGIAPYVIGVLVMSTIGAIMLAEFFGWIPRFPLRYAAESPPPIQGEYLLILFVAFASTLWITLYFARSIRAYVDRAHEEIRQQEKMVGIGQLVAGIGHQIANPLDGVQNCLRRIGEHVKDDPRLIEYVEMMEEALERIEKTTKRVQSFARPRGIELQDTSVNAAVEATLQLLGTRQTGGVTVQRDLQDVPLVRGDPYTLQEVLFNLCMNAISAMPSGGTLTIRTTRLGPHDDTNPGDVAIRISDTGVGIPRSQLEKVFEPFYTTRPESGGTGLGLGLCRMLISEMGGRIHVHSVLNEGTTFTVILHHSDTNPRDASKQHSPQ